MWQTLAPVFSAVTDLDFLFEGFAADNKSNRYSFALVPVYQSFSPKHSADDIVGMVTASK
jgi:hypothetical protein